MRPNTTHSNNKIPTIESLRALAVVLTVLHHLPFLYVWENNPARELVQSLWVGVDLFFCISGYVIMRSILDRPETSDCMKSRSWSNLIRLGVPFWIRRAWRLWPNALLWAAIPVLCSILFPHTGTFGPTRVMLSDALAAITHVANFHWNDCALHHVGLCDIWRSQLTPYWSLSLEEQFYLVLPAMLILLGKRWLPWGLLLIIVIQAPMERAPWQAGWPFRTEAICLGALLAMASYQPWYSAIQPRWPTRWHRLGVQTALLLILISLPVRPTIVPFSTFLVALVCAVLVWIACADAPTQDTKNWTSRTIDWVASRSYSIYLANMTTIGLTRELWFHLAPPGTAFSGAYTVRFTLTSLLMLAVAAELSYRLVETPLRLKGANLARQMRDRLQPLPHT